MECGKFFSKVNIKKGQWISPKNILGAVNKVRSMNGTAEVWLCERGSQFGYDRLMIDFSSVDELRTAFDRVFLDCTHSTQTQRPNGRTGGDRAMAEKYLLSSPVFGYDGVFAEVHPDPSIALSDADCQLELDRVPELLLRYDTILTATGNQVHG